MTPQALRNSILERAIEGKLVEQRVDEGTAEELYQEIQAEKKRLIQEGKLKKGKPLPAIAEDEIPFEIPGSWKWVRLQEIVYNHGQRKPTETFSYIDIGSIDNRRQKLNAKENILKSEEAPSRARRIVKKGDILYSTVRPYLHNMCIIDRDFLFTPIASTGFAVMSCYRGVHNKFLFYYLLSPSFDSYANSRENAKGVAYPAINDTKLYKAPVPLPPLAEQERIVEKIEEFVPFVEAYERDWQKLEDLNRTFPEEMKKSILQEAIRGRLVEQREEEGTAEALYREIQAEKKRLVGEGKLKKEKPLPAIAEDEMPFEIPESWKWVRLGEIFSLEMGQSPKGSAVHEGMDGIEFHQGKVMFGNKFLVESDKRTTQPTKIAEENSILLCVRAPVGKVNITPRKICIGRGLCALNPILMNLDYAYYLLIQQEASFIKQSTGTTFKAISKDIVRNQPIPLPPLAEQERIVERIEELLPLCDGLGDLQK